MTQEKISELKSVMVKMRVSVPELATAMGIHVHTLYRKFETGTNFSRSQMDSIRKKLKLTDKEFIGIFFA